jgi:hypothetical protein
MNSHKIIFSGEILERGFWLYLWKVKSDDLVFWYVGRTGDNSSPNAASPFSRLSLHLDLRDKATANTLVRNLRSQGLEPSNCKFELFSVGPIFPEQATFEEHKPYRDIVGLLEAELAEYVRSKGHQVMGSHPSRGEYDKGLFTQVKNAVEEFISG